MRNRVIASILLLGLALPQAGCWLGTHDLSGRNIYSRRIDVAYQRSGGTVPVAGASAAIVSVDAMDGRTVDRDRVGAVRNDFGYELGVITATNDIPQTVGTAVEQELRTRGFQIGAGHATISIEVVRFYDDFRNEGLSWSADATVKLSVTVRNPAKSIVFTKHYEGVDNESSTYAQGALIKAFQIAVNSVVSDKALQAALFAAQQP